ncbi:hypothetical protein HYFRA_00003929 [Hymenoscyphus fraxineus]|uniref:O-methyltransferase C-terminal domain-containing protein n=1 Tax=Hymenoscyphus fraxineus TaxID=746836 RepID=A0A9N9PUT2_9HELO|nr:hypothetical protein HYFRA_00003929 [Hymenoscyphus fraxineus]
MTSTSRILELSTIISTNTQKIDTYLLVNDLPQPSFQEHGPLKVLPDGSPPELEQARIEAVEASIELQQLLQGPDSLLTPTINSTALTAIHEFKLALKVPLEGEISFVDLAELGGIFEHDLRRIIRFAISHHRIFLEPRKGFVAHSAASKRLAESQILQMVVGLTVDDVWPAQARTVDALKKFGKSQEPNASGFALANHTDLQFYSFLSQYPERAKRFGGVMSSSSTAGLQALVDKFPWSSLPENGLVVDLGGSQGHVSAFLAEAIPSLRFVVQDLPEVISDTESTYRVPEAVANRVVRMEHDFFTAQPLKDVDVVLIRYIFHNWSDEYCIRILRNLIPGLKPGAQILIQDHLMPEPKTLSLAKERDVRAMDMIMLSLFNSREREEDDWKELVAKTDSRFRFESAERQAQDSASGIIVVSWQG